LRKLRASLGECKAFPRNEIEAWIASAAPLVRTVLPEHLADFERLSKTPQWAALPGFSSGGSRWDGTPPHNNFAEVAATEREINTGVAETARANLLAWLDGLVELSEPAPSAPASEPLTRVMNILDRIPAAVRVLSSRRQERPALVLNDEYDLQYLLHALLVVEFRDVRPEEWTPSYAGSSSRMDFLLKQQKIVIETKYVRGDHDDHKIADELVVDKARYASHPGCKTLVCFVYDPVRALRNPEAIQNDLRSLADPPTEVMVRPL
jgi:DpnII restriction endonuclease